MVQNIQKDLWEVFKDYLAGDLKRRFPTMQMNMIYEKGLKLLDQTLKYHAKSLKDFKDMPQITGVADYIDEDDIYDPQDELEISNRLINMMNNDQKNAIKMVTDVLEGKSN